MADPMPPPPLRQRPLVKHKSWSPDLEREEAWERRKDLQRARRGRRSVTSVTDDDFDELRGCIDLGIVSGDGSSDGSDCSGRISEILPALDLYLAIRRGLKESASIGSSGYPSSDGSPAGSPLSIFSSGTGSSSPSEMKANLKQWAQVVASSVRHCY
ncbi:hypothetical protein KSP39_PZI009992 [Platanthera zijinensis]|uniref:Uncharacterized protein n=1 Tax=Platanthera zijinensis TaxID=2320716 RepID=A0AAP0G640_9ASPA